MTDDLARLAALHAAGSLTDGEYAAAKAAVIRGVGGPDHSSGAPESPSDSERGRKETTPVRPTAPGPNTAARIAAKDEAHQMGQLITGVIIVLAVLGVMWTCGACDSSDEPAPSATSAPSQRSALTGDAVRLQLPGNSGPLLVATSEESFERLSDALVARDNAGIAEVLMSGGAFSVDAGTEALMLDPGFLKSKVRVTSGPMAGRAGWLAREFAVAR